VWLDRLRHFIKTNANVEVNKNFGSLGISISFIICRHNPKAFESASKKVSPNYFHKRQKYSNDELKLGRVLPDKSEVCDVELFTWYELKQRHVCFLSILPLGKSCSTSSLMFSLLSALTTIAGAAVSLMIKWYSRWLSVALS
jgi:hypothetical protein